MIPAHMAKCPRHGSLPVPCVVATTKGHVALEPSNWPGADMQTVWVPSNEIPDFGKYDEEKNRTCIAERRCHVCWNQNPCLLVCVPHIRSPLDAQRFILPDGSVVAMVSQPWVCAPCLAFACKNCPPLQTAIKERRGLVAYPKRSILVSTFYRPVNPEDPVPPPGARVIMSIKIALVKASWTPLPAFARQAH